MQSLCSAKWHGDPEMLRKRYSAYSQKTVHFPLFDGSSPGITNMTVKQLSWLEGYQSVDNTCFIFRWSELPAVEAGWSWMWLTGPGVGGVSPVPRLPSQHKPYLHGLGSALSLGGTIHHSGGVPSSPSLHFTRQVHTGGPLTSPRS